MTRDPFPVDDMLLATPSPLSLGGRLRAVGLGCDGETEVVVDVTDRGVAHAVVAEFIASECGYPEPTDAMVGQAVDLLTHLRHHGWAVVPMAASR